MAKLKINLDHLKRENIKKQIKEKTEEESTEFREVKLTALNSRETNLTSLDINLDFNFVEDKELNSFLVEKSKELIRIQAGARLELGRIFEEVNEKLAGNNRYNGFYIKWLTANGYNQSTALRHRNRYRLYQKMEKNEAKVIIATAPQKIIDTILNNEEQDKIIEKLNDSMTKEELSNYLFKDDLPKIEKVEDVDTILEEEYKKFEKISRKIDITKLSNSKKQKLEKLIREFFKLVGEE